VTTIRIRLRIETNPDMDPHTKLNRRLRILKGGNTSKCYIIIVKDKHFSFERFLRPTDPKTSVFSLDLVSQIHVSEAKHWKHIIRKNILGGPE
jgi:hypothetical protein